MEISESSPTGSAGALGNDAGESFPKLALSANPLLKTLDVLQKERLCVGRKVNQKRRLLPFLGCTGGGIQL